MSPFPTYLVSHKLEICICAKKMASFEYLFVVLLCLSMMSSGTSFRYYKRGGDFRPRREDTSMGDSSVQLFSSPIKKVTDEMNPLKGFVRGHKCLFDDGEVRSSNAVLLLRGADSHQRLLYPLELETNKYDIKGAGAALVMFNKREEAVSHMRATADAAAAGKRADGGLQMLKEDMDTYYRVIQLGTAAGLRDYVRADVMRYAAELYQDVGADTETLVKAVEALKEFFLGSMDATGYKECFVPAVDGFVRNVHQFMPVQVKLRVPLTKSASKPACLSGLAL
eukprot:GHVU01038269.1.p1 GENE.GHVU01038269.1~~GHVU01038269.1.p1  ORF type:complete len:281 (+),score=32.14 GHVU01038269.1:1078-1920(+)